MVGWGNVVGEDEARALEITALEEEVAAIPPCLVVVGDVEVPAAAVVVLVDEEEDGVVEVGRDTVKTVAISD